MSYSRSVDINFVNRKTYRGLQAVRQYQKAHGYLDIGEQNAFNFAFSRLGNHNTLDIGIGGGRTVPLLNSRSEQYLGIDYIDRLVKATTKKYPNILFKVMDARKLELPPESFSLVVFSNNGIDSLDFEDRILVLQQVHKVLQKRGLFIFSALNHNASPEAHIDHSTGNSSLRTVKRLVSFPFSVYNKMRLKELEVDFEDRSRRVINAHFNGLVATFTSISYQTQQLNDYGFNVQAIFSTKGSELGDHDLAAFSSYVHYVVEKM